jgi:hypothetical protein
VTAKRNAEAVIAQAAEQKREIDALRQGLAEEEAKFKARVDRVTAVLVE